FADDVDVSRTVGWFTTTFPVLLVVPEGRGHLETIESVKARLRAVPERGLGYGLLRYGGGDPESALADTTPPELSFNYLGQTEGMLSGQSIFRPARENSGPTEDPSAPRPHLLDVGAIVIGGRMRLNISYSDRVHDAKTAEALVNDFASELRAL